MEERRPRERELVLAPNEYAYVLDTTKGHINCYVGPNKTSLAQTDLPVRFDEETKRFEPAEELRVAIQLFATAPSNWYMVLKNPTRENSHPSPGVASNLVDLQVGRQVNVPGPASFALWPGQTARVIEGHRLRSNQYLLIQIHDAEEAAKHGPKALGIQSVEGVAPRFLVGDQHIIQGTSTSFYIPPNGVEVVPDAQGRHVRDAVTLQRLEYCVLVGEDGRKQYTRGEAVVFPEPGQQFLTRQGSNRFKALELNEISGIYVKVTAPYVDEDGVQHHEGEELFITGANRIYFPREEHAIIRHGDQEVHHALAIPAGEGRYVLNRLSGEVSLRKGPLMFLPDPRHEVITRRVLGDRECRLMFPGNEDALALNRALRTKGSPVAAPAAAKAADVQGKPAAALEADGFFRASTPPPRTITLDNKYEGAVTVEVWSGHAVQVMSRSGARRVVTGPATVLLEYDETLEQLSLSTGTPKNHDARLTTAFLQVRGNQVSDRVDVITSDLVRAQVLVKYRVNFEGDAAQWFAVDNYVKLLSDHASSLIKSAARRLSIRELKTHITELVRDAVLGPKPEATGRKGLRFEENGMRVHDVEVLDLDVADEAVQELLQAAQMAAIRTAIALAEKEASLAGMQRAEQIDRQLSQEGHQTRMAVLQLKADEDARAQQLAAEKETRRAAFMQQQRQAELLDMDAQAKLLQQRVASEMVDHAAALQRRQDGQNLETALLAARVEGAVKQAQAYSPDLVAALNRLSDAQLLSSLAGNFGELAAVEGKGLLETARKFLDFVPASQLPTMRTAESTKKA